MWIRIILLAGILATLVFFVRSQHGQRLRANKRIAFVLFLLANTYAVIRPDDLTWVAARVGVGRGADLVLYLLVVAFVFATANLYLRQRQLEARMAAMARAFALREAELVNLGMTREPASAAVSVGLPRQATTDSGNGTSTS
jgi:hypothetical protein